MEGAKY